MTLSNQQPAIGLHLSADGRLKRTAHEIVDISIAQRARVERVKVLSMCAPEDVEALHAAGFDPALILVRLFAAFQGRVVSPDDFVHWVLDDAMRLYALGCRLFEVHNEPNLKSEGMFVSWSNGYQFAGWFRRVAYLLSAAMPGARFGFPGLSPAGAPFADRADDLVFAREAQAAIDSADFVCAHCYWQSESEFASMRAGGAWGVLADRAAGKDLYITEASNPRPDVSKEIKARQALAWFNQLPTNRGIKAVFFFVATASSGFDSEVWEASPMPDIIASRTPVQPQPQPNLLHTVLPGETLLKIARTYAITLSEILRLNPAITNPSLIHAGQKIVIKALAQAPDPQPTPLPAAAGEYVEVSRAEWGARVDVGINGAGFTGWDITTRRLGVIVPATDRLAVIIHHTVGVDRDPSLPIDQRTPNEWESFDEIFASMRGLQVVRSGDLGPDVPYNFVVYPMADGRTVIAEGRGWMRSGSHTSVRSFNRIAIAYAWAGDFEHYGLPRAIDSHLAAVGAHARMLKASGLASLGTLRPGSTRDVFAHKDVWVDDRGRPYTACPGKLLYAKLDAIKLS